MTDSNIDRRIDRLKTIKSAFILEARSLQDQGLAAYAMPFYRKAGELENELAQLFHAQHDDRNASVSELSAASCLVQARQYQAALQILEKLAGRFPEAERLMAECRGKEDVPVHAATPALESLVHLLVRKRVISEGEWTQALKAG